MARARRRSRFGIRVRRLAYTSFNKGKEAGLVYTGWGEAWRGTGEGGETDIEEELREESGNGSTALRQLEQHQASSQRLSLLYSETGISIHFVWYQK